MLLSLSCFLAHLHLVRRTKLTDPDIGRGYVLIFTRNITYKAKLFFFKMVVFDTLLDILDTLPQTESFSLPAFKQKPLKIKFTKDVSFPRSFPLFCKVLPFNTTKMYTGIVTECKNHVQRLGTSFAVCW